MSSAIASGGRRRSRAPLPRLSVPVQGHPDWLCRAALRACHDGKYRMRVDFEDNVVKLVRAIGRKAYASGNGEGLTSYRQLAEVLYGPELLAADPWALERVKTSVKRWMRGAERAGLVAFTEALRPDGRSACLRWRQLDPCSDSVKPEAVAEAVAELAPAPPDVRQHFTRRQRRQHRWTAHCPRAGRGATRRLIDPGRPSLSSTAKTDPPGRSCMASPCPTSLGRAPAHEAGGPGRPRGLDAIERACPPDHRAALRRLRTAGIEGERLESLQAAADNGAVHAVPAALAAWALTTEGREPRLSRRMAAQLDRSAAQLDRLHGDGTAAGWIVHRIIAGMLDPIDSDDRAYGRRRRRHETDAFGRRFEVVEHVGITSLAFYVLQLRQTARDARRHALRRPRPRAWRSRGDV